MRYECSDLKMARYISVCSIVFIVSEGSLVSPWFGVLVFTICIGVYGYYRFSAKFHSRSVNQGVGEKSSEKLFRSKVHDTAFFDGESEEYTEAKSRLRTYGGG